MWTPEEGASLTLDAWSPLPITSLSITASHYVVSGHPFSYVTSGHCPSHAYFYVISGCLTYEDLSYSFYRCTVNCTSLHPFRTCLTRTAMPARIRYSVAWSAEADFTVSLSVNPGNFLLSEHISVFADLDNFLSTFNVLTGKRKVFNVHFTFFTGNHGFENSTK